MEIKNLTLQSTPHNFPFRLYLINTIFPLQIIPIFLVITTHFSFNPSSRTSPFLGVLLRCSIPPSTPHSHINISTPYRLKSATHRHLLAFCYAVASLLYPPLSHQHFHALSSQICHTSPFLGVLLPCSVPPPIPTFPRSIPLLYNRLSML